MPGAHEPPKERRTGIDMLCALTRYGHTLYGQFVVPHKANLSHTYT